MSTATVASLMTSPVHHCRTSDTLDRAARVMWENDCGALPVIDAHGNAVGMITDRDICMAAYTQGKPIGQVPVPVAASHRLHSVDPDDSVAVAEEFMKRHRVRRLAVVDRGKNLVGIISLADIVRRARSTGDACDAFDSENVARVLADVFQSDKRCRAIHSDVSRLAPGGCPA